MRRSVPVSSVLVAVAVSVAVSGCTSTRLPVVVPAGDPAPQAAPLRLVSFNSCDDLLRGLRDAARRSVGPYGFGSHLYGMPGAGGVEDRDAAPVPAAPGTGAPGPAAGAAAPDHSSTNVHEAGVDEPDVVKTDGRRIVTVSRGVLRVVDAATRRVTGTLRLGNRTAYYGEDNLLLVGDRALVLRAGFSGYGGVAVDAVTPGGVTPLPPDTVGGPVELPSGPQVVLVDLARATPRLLGTLDVDGRYLDARMVGSTARVVLSSTARIPVGFDPNATTDTQRLARNRQVIGRTGIDAWLPRYVLRRDGRTTSGRVDCSAVSTPASYSGTAMLTVLTFDLNAPLGTGDPVSIAADGDTVYATAQNLYVATDQRWQLWRAPVPREVRTELYQFDISGSGRPRFAASGAVDGALLNQYSMSEFGGRLRVATTSTPQWLPLPVPVSPQGAPGRANPRASDSAVAVLTQHGERLALTGLVRGLGAGEQIYAVRFVGPTGYVVTFRRTDPLYVVDLRDPVHPRVAGELKMTGYSAYLHPLDGDRLLGVGQEAGTTGAVQGLQVSLFDVSDPARPTRIARHVIGGAHSDAEYDPHAFLYWPATGTLVLPVQSYAAPGGAGALVLAVHDGGLTEVGTVRPARPEQWFGQARCLVVGGTLWTLSQSGLQANDLASLARQAWLPFG